MCKVVSSKPWRGNLEIDKLEMLAVGLNSKVDLPVVCMGGWVAAVKQSSEKDEKFLGTLDLYMKYFGVG